MRYLIHITDYRFMMTALSLLTFFSVFSVTSVVKPIYLRK